MGEGTRLAGDTPPVGTASRRLWAVLRRWPWAQFVLLAPLVALLPLVWRLLTHAATVLAYPWQIDYDEGIVLHAAWLAAHGHNPYQPLRPETFVSATYPPLFYLVTAPWLRLAGPSLLSGRAISLVATLVIAAVLAWWVGQERRSRLAGALTAALWLSLSPVYVWSTFFKPDLLTLSLTVSGLAVARRWPAWPGLGWAVGLFTLAFFSKQTALVGPLAVGLWLLTGRGPWRSFGLAMAGLLGGLFLLGNVVLDGGLWTHVVLFQQLPWSRGQLAHNLEKLVDTYPWLLAAVGLALLWPVAGRPGAAPDQAGPVRLGRWRWPMSLPVWYLAAVLPVVLAANGRIGVNYGLLLDLFPPLCLVVGVAAAELGGQPGAWRRWLGAVVSGLVLVQAVLPNSPATWYSANRMPAPERARQMAAVAGIVAQAPGQILSEDLHLLLRASKPIVYDDPFMMAQTAQRGLWDERRFVADLEAQHFSLVLLEYDITTVERSPRWSPAALAALKAKYEVLHRDVVFVYRPRPLLARPGTRQDIVFGEQLRLVETAVSTATARPGGTIRVMLRWGRAAPPTADYKLFVHLVDPAGRAQVQVDVPPSTKPTRAWTAAERAEAEYGLTLPADAPAGRYQVLVGVYDVTTGQRLSATRAGGPAGDTVTVAEVRVGDG